MLVHAMLERIESGYEVLRARNSFYRRIRNGEATPLDVALFIRNIVFLVSHTPIHLTLAAKESARQGDAGLEAFFLTKLGEEQGHDEWGREDLGRIHSAFSVPILELPVLASMKEIIRYNELKINERPLQYLAHIVLAEYLTVIATPQLSQELKVNCGISESMLSIFTNHVELDVHHVDEWSRLLPQLVGTPEDEDRLLDSLDGSIERYDRFCQEIGTRAA